MLLSGKTAIFKLMKEVNIRDVAKAAGVSHSTVSRVLNGHPNVSLKIKNAVLASVREKGYRLDDSPENTTIAILLCGDFLGYQSSMLNAFMPEIKKRGFKLEIIQEYDMDIISEKLVSGVISLEFHKRLSHCWNKFKGIPMVCINDYGFHIDNVYSVSSDEVHGIGMALEYLKKNGHRNSAFIAIGGSNFSNDFRKKSFLESASRLSFIKYPCFNTDFESLGEILSQCLKDGISSVIGSGETTGMHLLRAAREREIRIPKDLSVISWEWNQVSECCNPPLTTIAQDFAEISRTSLNILQRLIRGKTVERDLSVKYILHERESVRLK